MCFKISIYLITLGAMGIIKAVISEVSNDSNQAFGIAVLGLAYGSGLISGQVVSSVMSDPIGQYNLTIDSK